MFAIRYRKFFYTLSALLALASIASFWYFGIRPSVEFTGGSLMEISYQKDVPTAQSIETTVKETFKDEEAFAGLTVQKIGDTKYVLRFGEIGTDTHQALLQALPGATELQFQDIGPVIGSELRRKTIWGLILAVIGMFIYVGFAFRKVPAKIRSWKMGVSAIITLTHDILLTAGGFTVISYFYGFDMGILFVAAELTIWGYSINDTIVVFDRVRENILKEGKRDLTEIVGASLTQTIGRSLSTSFTVLLSLCVMLAIGPAPLQPFVVPLVIGVIVGAYSSIFIATPLLIEHIGKTE